MPSRALRETFAPARALFLLLLVLLLGGVASVACTPRNVASPVPFTEPVHAADVGARFAVLGDTQRNPSFLGLGSNDEERALVLRAVADAGVDLVVLTGDLVYEGLSAGDWQRFEALTKPLRDRHVSVVAALGNHEYQGIAGRGEGEFFARFPLLEHHRWFQIAFGPVRLVVLDSSESAMSPEAWEAQRAWYEAILAADDGDAAVRGVLVVAHHPPYTNSTVTTDEEHVKRAFVPALLRSRKALAYVSGHVHNYERFVVGGKTFVVSGGGGGPRAAVDTTEKRPHKEDRFVGPPLRPFHFCVYTLTSSGLSVEVRGLRGGTFATFDRFDLPFPSPV